MSHATSKRTGDVVQDFTSVCLGHLFTYRDFKGTIGLAWVADPSELFSVRLPLASHDGCSWKICRWNL